MKQLHDLVEDMSLTETTHSLQLLTLFEADLTQGEATFTETAQGRLIKLPGMSDDQHIELIRHTTHTELVIQLGSLKISAHVSSHNANMWSQRL